MAKPQPKQKLHCYIDETGQDTEGRLFLVAIVVASDEREELIREVEKIEQASGKSLKNGTGRSSTEESSISKQSFRLRA